MLKRHLMSHYNMTPEQYRERWGLPADYPMVAPNYALQRQVLAKKIGLGKGRRRGRRSEEHTSELQSLMRISYAVFCLKKKKTNQIRDTYSMPAKPHTHNQDSRKSYTT